MTLYWICAAALLAVALLFLLWPLLKTSTHAGGAKLAREKLDALQLLESLGTVAADEIAQRRAAISQELIAALDGGHVSAKPSYKTATVAGILVIASALILYERLGNPLGLDVAALRPLAQATQAPAGAAGSQSASPHDPQDMQKAITELRGKLSETRKDLEGWLLLARSYNSVQQFDDQLRATEVAYKLAPDSPEVLIEYAEALALGKYDRQLSGEPEKLLQAALKIDPNAQKAMWLTGIAAVQRGEPGKALEVWERLKTMLEPGSQVMASLEEQMGRARAQLEGTPAATNATVDGPSSSPAPIDAPAIGSVKVTVDISTELKSKLQPGDVLFVFARAESGPPMPLAIDRRAVGEFPVNLVLDDSKSMLPDMKLSLFDRIVVGARVSKSGNAIAQSGDFQTLSAPFSHAEKGEVSLTIDQLVP